jgi:hypothetical protein
MSLGSSVIGFMASSCRPLTVCGGDVGLGGVNVVSPDLTIVEESVINYDEGTSKNVLQESQQSGNGTLLMIDAHHACALIYSISSLVCSDGTERQPLWTASVEVGRRQADLSELEPGCQI